MDRITTKLLLWLITSTALLLGFLWYHNHSVVDAHFRHVVERQASMALQFDLSIRKYAANTIRPQMSQRVGEDEFIPATMSTSYIARSIFDDVRDEFPGYILKFSSDNPRNPANQAGPEELKIIQYLNENPHQKVWEGIITINGKKYMGKFGARRMTASCLRCHGDPKDAPASLIAQYGDQAGFHRPLGEIIGLDTVAIPLSKISEGLWSESSSTFSVVGIGLCLFFFSTAIALRFLIVNRVQKIAGHFQKASLQENHRRIEPIPMKGKDEISQLAQGFNLLVAQLRQYYASMEEKVDLRTQDLKEKNRQLETEIENHRQTVKALRESEERFRQIYAHMAVGIARVSMDFRIESANEAYCRMLGYREAELIGKHLKDITHPEMLEVNLLEQTQLAQGKIDHYRMEKRFIHKQGREICGILDANLVRNAEGTPSYFLDSVLDISDLKKVESELQSEKDLLEGVLDSIKDVICVQLPDYTVVRYNQAGYKLFGLDRSEDLVGRKCYEFMGKEAPCDMCSTDQAMASKQIETIENYLADTDKYYLCTSNPLFDETGSIKLIIRQLVDITEKKKMDAQLQQAEKIKSIGNLAGGIAHDFNNLLFPIVGMSELLLDDFAPGSPEHEKALMIYQAGKRGSDLVKQILAFSRQSEHQKKPTRMQQVLEEVLQLSRSTIPTDIEFVHDLQTDCGLVMADPTQIHQVAMNLITNAFHAIGPNPGEITVSLDTVELGEVIVNKGPLLPGMYACMRIADTGTDIDPAIQDKIFDPYFTTKEQGKGTGLGLAVAHGIVKEHGGDIGMTSKPGEGTTFTVYLPLIEKAIGANRSPQPSAYPTGSERILLVDDEAAIVDIERLMLQRLGYAVTTRCSSIDALKAFEQEPDAYDLVVTDMTMPNMTGDRLAAELITLRPDIPIIICSGYSERMNAETAQSTGVKGFLMKPVGVLDMAEMVRKVLDKHQR